MLRRLCGDECIWWHCGDAVWRWVVVVAVHVRGGNSGWWCTWWCVVNVVSSGSRRPSRACSTSSAPVPRTRRRDCGDPQTTTSKMTTSIASRTGARSKATAQVLPAQFDSLCTCTLPSCTQRTLSTQRLLSILNVNSHRFCVVAGNPQVALFGPSLLQDNCNLSWRSR